MELRRFTTMGLEAFRSFIEVSPNRAVPPELLSDRRYSTKVPGGPTVTIEPFSNRFSFGKHLVHELKRFVENDHLYDVGLWSWLALFYFDLICPLRRGERNPSRTNYYILDAHEWTRYYHHMVRTPYILVSMHGATAEVLLTQSLDVSGETIEQFVSRQDIVTNRSIIQTINRLYLTRTPEGVGKYKSGSTNRKTKGTFRRFVDVMSQLELTYDLRTMTDAHILQLLPSEFDKFKKT